MHQILQHLEQILSQPILGEKGSLPSPLWATSSAVLVAIKGGVRGLVDASLILGEFTGSAGAKVEMNLADINCIVAGKKGCISIFYEANFGVEIPSFIDILLMDPQGIIDAVDGLFQLTEGELA